MKGTVSVIGVVIVGLLYFGILTQPAIVYHEGDASSFIGGAVSHADACYYDYRPSLEEKGRVGKWCGTAAGEWRRLDTFNANGGSSYTVAVLRDRVSRFARTPSVERGSHAAAEYEEMYQQVRRDYQKQSWLKDRLWYWDVRNR